MTVELNGLLAACMYIRARRIYRIGSGANIGYYTFTFRKINEPLTIASEQDINFALNQKLIRVDKNPHMYQVCG